MEVLICNEAAAVIILKEEDSLLWPDVKKAESLFIHKLDCAADRPKLCIFYESFGFKKVRENILFGKYPTAFYEYEIMKSSLIVDLSKSNLTNKIG